MRSAREQALSALFPVRDGAGDEVAKLLIEARRRLEAALVRTPDLEHTRLLRVRGEEAASTSSDALLLETSFASDLDVAAAALFSALGDARRELLAALAGGSAVHDARGLATLIRAHEQRVGAVTTFTEAPADHVEGSFQGALFELALLVPHDIVECAHPEEDLVELRSRAARAAERAELADPGAARGLVLLVPAKPGALRAQALRALLRSRVRSVLSASRARVRLRRARAVMLRGRGLLFSLDFEGRLDAALDELAVADARFSNALFSQTLGFPRCIGAHFGGVRDEERFRLWIDAHRLENGVRSADPHDSGARA
jgi:hypothetical protein